MDSNQEIPFSLPFDALVLKKAREYPSNDSSTNPQSPVLNHEKEAQQSITNYFKKYQTSDFSSHNKLMDLARECGIKHIFTTNYDHNLECSVTGKKTTKKATVTLKNKETKYSMFRCNALDKNTHVWHPHGDMANPASILLGYEHYAGTLQKMRNYLTQGINVTQSNKDDQTRHQGKVSPWIVSSQDKTTGFSDKFEENEFYSWIDIFLRDTVHIIGFSMDFAEIDIWWLLIWRAKNKERMAKIGKNFGQVIFHSIETENHEKDRQTTPLDSCTNSRAKKIATMLKEFDVVVRQTIVEQGNYEEAYNKIFENIRRDSSKKA